MKKRFPRWLLLTVLLCLAISPALANSWGLSGDLLQVVMEDERWNDYSAITRQQGNFAVLGGRYHNVLMQCKDGKLLTYPLAVWQETDQPNVKKPQLTLNAEDQTLTLSYGEHETYVFRLDYYPFDPFYVDDALVFAEVDGLTFNRDGYGFTVSDGKSTVLWQHNVVLKDFNIKLFPRSVEEVTHLNRMTQLLDGADRLGTDLGGSITTGTGKGTAPVYSAPFGDSAWRAAKGKAALGLSGEYWTMGTYRNADGEAYAKLRYEVSERTQRVGYVRVEDLDLQPGENDMPKLIRVPLEARTDTYLTDDPVASQYQQFFVPQGTQFTCMGLYSGEYAYVSAEVKDGKFVDGGQIVWGYVPLRDVTISSGDEYRNTIEWNAMAEFAGQWFFSAGGVGVTDVLTLHADGTWEGYTDAPTGGTWQLNRYHPADNLYWSEVPYEISFFWPDGAVCTYGFWPEESGDGFSLLYWEGSGGYERLEEGNAPSEEGANG